MFMTQPLLTHAVGFPLLILVGWIPVLLLDLGALGLGLNRASFNDSNPGWFQPLPPVPLDFIFSHTQLYYRMLASQSLKGPQASLIQCLLFWMKKLRPRGRKGLAQGHPSRWGQKIQTSSHVAQGSETTLQTSASLVAVLFGTGQFSFFELATVTFSSPREAADSDGLSAFTV